MKDRNLIKNSYFKKIKKINGHNKLYYEKSSPIISDIDYDNLKKEIIELEKKYTFLKSKSSPSLLGGAKPAKSFLKSRHRVKMLSLSNIFSKDNLINFEKKICKFARL